MANLKLIVVTGAPFSRICVGCIGIQTDPESFQIIRDGRTYTQYASLGDGCRLATQEDIKRNWSTIYPHWTPEVGDNVIVTQDYSGWANCKGTIIEKDNADDYYRVESVTGRSCIFDYTRQMILAPYSETKVEPEQKAKPSWKWQDLEIGDKVKIISGDCSSRPVGSIFAIDKMEAKDYGGRQPIRLVGSDGEDKGWPYKDHFEPYYGDVVKPKEETVTIRFLTEQQFKDQSLWIDDHPKGWNSDGHMNKYLGQSVVIPKSNIGSDGTFRYQDWTFKETDYIVTEWIPSKVDDSRDVSRTIASSGITFKSVVTPIAKPEKPLRRFKVGDKVTYKSRAECGGMYRYGGEDQEGFVGTVESEMSYDLERSCYDLKVTTKEGDFCYTMLESEFKEYDSGYVPNTSGAIGSSEPATRLVIKGAVATIDTDPLSLYKQKPITIKSKPKSKLTTI